MTSTLGADIPVSYTHLFLQAGKDVLALTFSSGLSTTFQSSVIAANELAEQYPDRKIFSVDTLCASMGQGLLVWLAVQEQRKGKSIEEVRDWVCLLYTSVTAPVFNIQSYSIHDGPGIRTTVFVKGCPLRCQWCSNPESWAPQPQVGVYRTKCIGRKVCGGCEDSCPEGDIFRFKMCIRDRFYVGERKPGPYIVVLVSAFAIFLLFKNVFNISLPALGLLGGII